MKKIILIAMMLIFWIGISAQNIRISNLPSADSLGNNDVVLIVQGGTTKKVSKTVFLNTIDNAKLDKADTIYAGTQIPLNADSSWSVVFGAGGGNAADTSAFTTSTMYGTFTNDGSDTLVVWKLKVLMMGDVSDTLSVNICWNDSLSTTYATRLNTTPLPVGRFANVNAALYLGLIDLSFNNTLILPGQIIMCTTPTIIAGRKPTYLNVQLGYKRQNRSY
jgi:hypothetical protein